MRQMAFRMTIDIVFLWLAFCSSSVICAFYYSRAKKRRSSCRKIGWHVFCALQAKWRAGRTVYALKIQICHQWPIQFGRRNISFLFAFCGFRALFFRRAQKWEPKNECNATLIFGYIALPVPSIFPPISILCKFSCFPLDT